MLHYFMQLSIMEEEWLGRESSSAVFWNLDRPQTEALGNYLFVKRSTTLREPLYKVEVPRKFLSYDGTPHQKMKTKYTSFSFKYCHIWNYDTSYVSLKILVLYHQNQLNSWWSWLHSWSEAPMEIVDLVCFCWSHSKRQVLIPLCWNKLSPKHLSQFLLSLLMVFYYCCVNSRLLLFLRVVPGFKSACSGWHPKRLLKKHFVLKLCQV